ncbi:uncharacterized protein K452DRAFT_283480 [Aplosporella prunicola CBS 121167]|uniref:Tim44-like domain-containing protein n=1 Tax=Aplosporella prunicola CBS 121167 TaxID=1176127 RepID=A0A6A6BSE6_9PEZI|nr:uncharacterized protein K452DRAFT_283480 [Aplosporella prunicola CBS 121167]KAF2146205.1 hypothetical protein K452DRAFT_283480 [Aplosporella prunicola CBS 121167]
MAARLAFRPRAAGYQQLRPSQQLLSQQLLPSQQSRTFAATRAAAADIDPTARAMEQMQKRPSTPSFRTQQKGQMMSVPNDMGLLPGTFVRPTGANLPGLFDAKARFAVEKAWVKSKFQNTLSLVVWKFFSRSGKPRPQLSRRQVPALGSGLLKEMYSAFAEGDVHTLSRICTDGLLDSFSKRIAARSPNERITWTLHGTPKVRIVSDCAVKVPVPGVPKDKPCGLRQVVVRIKSRQSLVRAYARKDRTGKETLVDRAGKPMPVDDKGEVSAEVRELEAKNLKEYVVLQRRMWMAKEEPWRVWGLVNETSIDKIEAQ